MEEKNKSGFMLIDKKEGPTSFDLVYKLRKITNIKKIGHAGTLDPFASGLMIMAIGRETTREINKFVKQDKSYIANLQLGARSSTHDPEGEIVETEVEKKIDKETIRKILQKYKGEIEQIPPMHSAKKIGGKKLYELARKGEVIERQASVITIYNIEIIEYNYPELILNIDCSSGTYIRALARDIGNDLQVGAYLKKLRRIRIGEFEVAQAKKIEEINSENWTNCLL